MATMPSNVGAFEHEWGYHILPDGRGVKFSYCDTTHVYRVENPFDKHCFEVPSVSGIIRNSGLGEDYSNVPAERLERKRIIGSYVAKAMHLFQLGELDLDSLDPEVGPYFDGYRLFLKESGFRVRWSERVVIGCINGLWWAGRLDLEGEWQGCAWILDGKITSEAHPSHEIQTAGYALAMPKPVKPPFRYKRGTLYLRPGTYLAPKEHKKTSDEGAFLSALRLEWERRRRGIR